MATLRNAVESTHRRIPVVFAIAVVGMTAGYLLPQRTVQTDRGARQREVLHPHPHQSPQGPLELLITPQSTSSPGQGGASTLHVGLEATSRAEQGMRVLYTTAIYDDRGRAVVPDGTSMPFDLPAGQTVSAADTIPEGLAQGFYYLEAIAGYDKAGQTGTTIDRMYFYVSSSGIDLVEPEDWVKQSNITVAHRRGT